MSAAVWSSRVGVPPGLRQHDQIQVHGVPLVLRGLQERLPPPQKRVDGRMRMGGLG
jgi:hypothetical protein